MNSGCLVWLNHALVPLQYVGHFHISNGDFLRVALAHDPDSRTHGAFTTREMAEVCYHRNEMFASLGDAGRPLMPDLTDQVPLDVSIHYTLPPVYADDDDSSLMQASASVRDPSEPQGEPPQPHLNPSSSMQYCQEVSLPSYLVPHPPELPRWDIPVWAMELQGQLRDIAVHERIPEADTLAPLVSTWFLNQVHLLMNRNSRWEEQLRAAWTDLLLPGHEVVYTVVTPRPFGRMPEIWADVILTQQPLSGLASGLVNVVQYTAASSEVMPVAVVMPRLVDIEIVLQSADIDHACPPVYPDRRCSVWHDTHRLQPDELLPIPDGRCFDVYMADQSVSRGPPVEDYLVPPLDESDGLQLLQLATVKASRNGILSHGDKSAMKCAQMISEFRIMLLDFLRLYRSPGSDPRTDEHLPSGDGSTPDHHPCRVCLQLDLLIPKLECEWNPASNMYQVFDEPSWQDLLQQPWDPALSALPWGLDLHPSTWEALHQQWDHEDHVTQWIEFYIDGSKSSVGGGWSVVAISACLSGRRFMGCIAGPVQLASSEPDWIGATHVSNITAEYSAAIVALGLALTTVQVPAVVRPDLKLSELIVNQKALPVQNSIQVQMLHALASCSSDRIWAKDVRSHQHDPWNELADKLARWAAFSQQPLGQVQWRHLHRLACSDVDRSWLWLQNATPATQLAFPPLLDKMVWPVNMGAPVGTIHFDPTDSAESTATCDLQIVSYNALALGQDDDYRLRSQRALRLDQQFSSARVHMVGLQEARTQEGVFVTDNYRIYSSGRLQSSRAPLFGCELWLHQRLPFLVGPDGVNYRLGDFKVVVVHADPRRLVVTLSGVLGWLIIVAHTPCVSRDTHVDQVQTWWDELIYIVRPLLPGRQVVTMLDANAPLASHETPHFGLFNAESMNAQGLIFQDAIVSMDLRVPSTLGL